MVYSNRATLKPAVSRVLRRGREVESESASLAVLRRSRNMI